MSTTEYPPQSFEAMSRKQAITTCYALETMRDRAVAEIERQKAGREIEQTALANALPKLVAFETAFERIGKVLFDHSHADTCATELSPDAGYECSCWRAGIWAALGMSV